MNLWKIMNGLSLGVLSAQVLISLFNSWKAFRLGQAPQCVSRPKVSLLVPFRNESENIPAFFSSLKKVNYPELEVLVLDDESTDDTYPLLLQHAQTCRPVTVIRGKAIPPHWVGKSWACHQLASGASGDILLFCDADVRMSSQAIEKTIAWMEVRSWDALTALPFQVMESWFEKAIIPFVMHLPVFGLVPLRLIPQLKSPSLVVANGQWLAIRKSAYLACGGHESVRSSLLEDMELARNLVRRGFKLAPVLATQDLSVRMYSSWKALQEGFTKNLYLLCGGNAWGLLAVGGLYWVTHAWPLVSGSSGEGWGLLGFALLLGFRGIVCASFSSSLFTIWLHPWGLLGFYGLLIRSTSAYFKKKTSWRGRWVSVG